MYDKFYMYVNVNICSLTAQNVIKEVNRFSSTIHKKLCHTFPLAKSHVEQESGTNLKTEKTHTHTQTDTHTRVPIEFVLN